MPIDSTETEPSGGAPTTIRLQRVMASAGIASRRQCEQIILEGRVLVDGQRVVELGTKVDPDRQKIEVDGQILRRRRHVYYMLNKPAGVLSTSHDESGRTRVIDLVDSRERVYTVGRLDKSSEGLILITNDGEWANRITHPRYGVSKTYLVRVVGRPSPEILARLRSGIRLAEGIARADEVRVRKAFQNCVDLEIVLREGQNREIRRIMAHVGHKVVMLKRIAIGPIRLGELPSGAYRELTDNELKSLQQATKETGSRPPAKRSRPHIGSRAKLGRYAAERRARWSNDRNKPKSSKRPQRGEISRGSTRRTSPRKNARNTKGRRR